MAKKIILFFLLIVLIFTRVHKLESLPISLNWDEVSHGYNALSILNTGKDQWSVSYPIYNFRAYGDYPTTLNMYATIPFIFLLGLNEFSIRIFTALMGILTVYSVYRLSSYFKIHNALSLLVLLTLSTTLFFTGRGVFQSTVASGLFFSGIYLFLSQKNKYKSSVGLVLLCLSQYAYHNTRIIVPMLILYLLFTQRNLFAKVNKFIIILTLVLTTLSIYNLATNKDASARNKWVSIFGVDAVNTINQRRLEFGPNDTKNRIINNKITYGTEKYIKNTFWFISPTPLFFEGTKNYQFHIPSMGLLQVVALPFFYLGFFYCIKNIRTKTYRDLLVLTLISTIPAALTQGDFPVLRLSITIPLYFIFIQKGLEILLTKKKYLLYLFLVIYAYQFLVFVKNYTTNYRDNFSLSWQYGYKELVQILKNKYPLYNNILVTKRYGEPHEFILFYWPWNPKSYQTDTSKQTDHHTDWYWVNSFDKFTFVNDWEMKDYIKNNQGKKLIVASPGTLNQNILYTIRDPNQNPIFEIFEVQ